MAASQRPEDPREALTCSLCLEHFTDPVCIDCGHNFCRPCITQCWQGVDADPLCPQCRGQCPGRALRPNRELENIAEVIKLSITPQSPPEHQQRLQLFCETDKTPICLVCDKSKERRGHDVIPVAEAAQEYKDGQRILNRCDDVKAQKPEDDVKVVKTLERGEHAHLQDKLMELKETFPGLVEFWTQMKIYEREVTLDPDTANGWLVLSEDGRSVRLRDREPDLPDTLKRDDNVPCLLGRERLSSGRHYWEVEVGDKTRWDLGVCDESASRIGDTPRTPRNGYWVVWLRDGGKYSACTSPLTPLTPCAPPRVVGLFLDYEGGRFSVYNAQEGSLLYTFSGVSFPPTLRPYFCPCTIHEGKNEGALRVLSSQDTNERHRECHPQLVKEVQKRL